MERIGHRNNENLIIDEFTVYEVDPDCMHDREKNTLKFSQNIRMASQKDFEMQKEQMCYLVDGIEQTQKRFEKNSKREKEVLILILFIVCCNK